MQLSQYTAKNKVSQLICMILGLLWGVDDISFCKVSHDWNKISYWIIDSDKVLFTVSHNVNWAPVKTP